MANLHPQLAIVAGSDSVGRVRITLPQFDMGTSAVARVCKHVGPLEADAEVLVVFIGGNANYPVVVGRF